MFDPLQDQRKRTLRIMSFIVVLVSAVLSCSIPALETGSGEETATLSGAVTPEPGLLPTDTVISGGEQATPTPVLGLRPIPFESVVQIITYYYDDNNQLVPGWTGSGSIISADGLILTNAHVVLPDRYFSVDALVVAVTVAEDLPPEAQYFAEVLQADEQLDIAVLRLTTDMNDVPLDFDALNLPFVPMGNADTLRLGDQVTILGYPGIGGETITLTRGEVSGFTSEAGRGARAFIKTSATIAGGNSGGLAADPEGYLIGIPTQLGYGGDDQFVDCRVLADTNRDGFVDDRDNCVPTGGFINALRPINLAVPLIEAARAGIVNVVQDSPVPTPEAGLPPEGTIIFQDDFSSIREAWAWEDAEGSVSHVSGELHLKVNQPEYFIWGVPAFNFTDVILEVDARVITAAGDGDFGLICRYQDNQNFYGMEISEDGYYTVWKMIDGETIPLVDWKYSSLITTDAPLRLGASCVGNSLALIVNGEFLAEIQDYDLVSGDAGLVAGTWEFSPFVVGFDNFVVRSPGQ